MACCTNVRRKAPMNFIFLFLFTLAEAFLLATAASTYDADAVRINKYKSVTLREFCVKQNFLL